MFQNRDRWSWLMWDNGREGSIIGMGGLKYLWWNRAGMWRRTGFWSALPALRTDFPSPGLQFPHLQNKEADEMTSEAPTHLNHSANTFWPSSKYQALCYVLEEDAFPPSRLFWKGRPWCTCWPKELRKVQGTSFPHCTGREDRGSLRSKTYFSLPGSQDI